MIMKCSKCQAENPDGAKFCGECGHKFEMVCPECGKGNSPGNKYCNDCGHALRRPQESTKIDYQAPQSYTPKHLAGKILTTRKSMEGERKLVTVLFADVAGFTALSEKLEPEEVHQIMEGCLKILMDGIHKYEGTINQFTGDGVMALFGAPLAHEDHAQRACYAALAIQKELIEYAEKIRKEYGQEFKMRIGLNSGPVVVGAIGDDLHMDYTAIGDTINLASRMEGLAMPGSVLLSGNTQRLVRDYFELNPIGPLSVKGKEEPQEVFELIKAGGAATRLEASMARGLTRFVGRENSLAALMEAYEKVKNGAGQVVGVVGEAGVGKSRLLFEFRQNLPQGEYGYLEGRCLHFGSAMPYLPIQDILRSFFEIKEGEREAVIRRRLQERIQGLDEKLSSTITPLQDLLSLKVEDEAYLKLEPKQRREKVFEALRDLIVRGSQERPLILAVEDLHWIDRTSEEFLDYLIGWLPNIKVLLILLHRPEYTHRWGSKSYFNRIGLDQLTLKSSAELVRAILEGGETAPELTRLILNRAAGNPLFMEELTHSLLENGSIQKTGNQFTLSQKASDLKVPDTIQGIIAARMDRLEENLKRIMQVASVIGREFAFRILQAISGVREDLKSQLLNLQGLEFIYEKSLFPELEYVFKHALTQEVAYNSLLSNRRKEIHNKIGTAIVELYAGSLEEFCEMLAYHYAKGEEIEKACHYLKLSGQKAVRSHALWEGYGFYKEAIGLFDKLPKTENHKKALIEVIFLMRTPMALLGYPEGSFDFLRRAEELAQEVGDARLVGRVYSSLAIYYNHKGEPLKALRYSEEGFKESLEVRDIELMVPLGFALCSTYQSLSQFQKTVVEIKVVVESIEQANRESDFFTIVLNPYTFICGWFGYSLAQLGRFEEGKTYIEKGLDNAIRIGDPATVGLIHCIYGLLFYFKGDFISANQHLEISLAYGEKAKWPLVAALSLSLLGHGRVFLGDPETGRKNAEKGIQIYDEIGVELFSFIHCIIGDIELYLENLGKGPNLCRRCPVSCQKKLG
jgi:class 3 adenylate cyclase/tetratricopeptide (TPR) repeat protein